MSSQLKINADYCDQITLKTGETVSLRLVRPSDKARLTRAFSELSELSRYKRFFAAKQLLTDGDLIYFTETDDWDHFALGAVAVDENNIEGDGLAVARCIRIPDDPKCAEVAITVIDRMQGKGIGRALLERLVGAAIERGITRFRFECLAHNHEIQHLLKQVCRVVGSHSDGGILTVETDLPHESIDIPAPSAPVQLFSFYELFRAMAIHSVEMQMQMGRSTINRSMQTNFIGAKILKQIKTPTIFKSH